MISKQFFVRFGLRETFRVKEERTTTARYREEGSRWGREWYSKMEVGAPDTNRTYDPRFRKPLLYPTELRGPVLNLAHLREVSLETEVAGLSI